MKRVLTTALVFIVSTLAAQSPDAMAGLVAAERNFAQTCGRVGIRDSFLEFFAEDVVTFGAHVRTGNAYLREFPPEGRNSPILRWTPTYGDVSSAGDLGYTTGPFVYTAATGETEYGMYFSIWRRQPDGKWKVALDEGLSTPAPNSKADQEFQSAPHVRYLRGGRFDRAFSNDALEDAERNFTEVAVRRTLNRALLEYGDPSLRLYRSGNFPIQGGRAISNYLALPSQSCKIETAASEVSSSGDLGFTYGRYEMSNGKDRGFFVRVWRRDEKGR